MTAHFCFDEHRQASTQEGGLSVAARDVARAGRARLDPSAPFSTLRRLARPPPPLRPPFPLSLGPPAGSPAEAELRPVERLSASKRRAPAAVVDHHTLARPPSSCF